jgi:hypothetical protein
MKETVIVQWLFDENRPLRRIVKIDGKYYVQINVGKEVEDEWKSIKEVSNERPFAAIYRLTIELKRIGQYFDERRPLLS